MWLPEMFAHCSGKRQQRKHLVSFHNKNDHVNEHLCALWPLCVEHLSFLALTHHDSTPT